MYDGVFGLVGPNGAGKTTFLRIMLGLIRPTQGTCTVFGRDAWGQSREIRRRLTALHERPAFPNLQSRRFLEHVAGIYTIADPHGAAEKALKAVGLLEASERQISHLSAGMFRKLGLAQALLGEPRLVVLDEPTANLDVYSRLELEDTIRSIRERVSCAFLVSSHDVSHLESLSSHLAIIDEGRLVEQGHLSDLRKRYFKGGYRISTSDNEGVEEVLNQLGEVAIVSRDPHSIVFRIESGESAHILSMLFGGMANGGVEIHEFQTVNTLGEILRSIRERR